MLEGDGESLEWEGETKSQIYVNQEFGKQLQKWKNCGDFVGGGGRGRGSLF